MIKFDIFCQVIDNFGDIGVVYRLGNELKKELNKNGKQCEIRIILDRTEELTKLNKKIKNMDFQVINGISFLTYEYLESLKSSFVPSNIIIEAFGCYIPQWYLDIAYNSSSLLINLEYLSSEDWALDFHLNESLIGAKKLKKFFFIPGLNPNSGGVLIDTIKSNNEIYSLEYFNNSLTSDFLKDKTVGTIFSYEHNFTNLINTLLDHNKNYILLILGEKSQESFLYTLKESFNNKENELENLVSGNIFELNNIFTIFLPFFSQEEYDKLVKLVDFNFVRGEDSFVRGVLSSKPFLWEAYCQDEFVHLDKVKGFLNNFNSCFDEHNIPKNFHNNLTKSIPELLDSYNKIMIQYNNREINSYTLHNPVEDFNLFFKNINDFNILNSFFKESVKSNCNLVHKLLNFIEKTL